MGSVRQITPNATVASGCLRWPETRATDVTAHSARRGRDLRRDRGGAFDD